MTSDVRCLSAAKVGLKVLHEFIGSMQEKMINFEKINLADKDMLEDASREYGKIKTKLEETNKNLKTERKKNQELKVNKHFFKEVLKLTKV